MRLIHSPPGGINECFCGRVLFCPGSILICAECLEHIVTKSSAAVTAPSTEQTIPKHVQIEDEIKGDNYTACKRWEHLKPDWWIARCGNKEEAMRKWRQAMARRPALTYLYNPVFPSDTPQKHIKIDDEERQLSDQHYSFPHRPRSHRMPILKMLLLILLLILLLLAYLISSDEFLSGVYIGLGHGPLIYVQKSGEDGVVRAMMN